MNTVVTSKEDILKASRTLIQKEGWSAINIRSVASACGVSVGSIYNYFDSKAALMGAVVESVWCEIFHRPENGAVFQDTLACISIPWAFWGKTSRTGGRRCSRPGSTFWRVCVLFCGGMQTYGRTPLPGNLQRKNLPTFSSP